MTGLIAEMVSKAILLLGVLAMTVWSVVLFFNHKPLDAIYVLLLTRWLAPSED